jgi:hypothetical protein
MKKILLISALFISTWAFGQLNCNGIISQRDFITIKNNIFQTRGFQSFQLAMDASRNYCFSAIQAKEIATTLSTERDRYDFLKSAYPNIVDKENFIDVLDAFRSFSQAFRLYHETVGVVLVPNNNNFNNHNNHNHNNQTVPVYNGRKNCNTPATFTQINQVKMQNQSTTDNRVKARNILDLTLQGCVTTAQAMELANGITDETIMLDVLKRMLPNIFDVDNYFTAQQLLLIPNNKNDFRNYILNGGNTNTNPNMPNMANCAMNDEEFRMFHGATQKLSFDNDKVLQIKTTLKNRCLKAIQIKQLMDLAPFDNSKLEIAKMMYDNCLDKNVYYLVNESFRSSSSVKSLNQYIQTRP